MSIWVAVLLGLVQGVAEFLPISSSGHLSILQNLFGIESAENGHMLFDVLLHLATVISVCIFYRKDILEMVREVISWFKPKSSKKIPSSKSVPPARRLILMLVIATLPLFLILPVNDYVEQLYYNTFVIGAILILTGFMLFVSDRLEQGRKNEKTMKITDAIIIGVCQAVATIPGLSRSGTTITAGMAVGLNREFAVKFSFLLSIPAILGANILSLADAISENSFDLSLLPAYLIGMVIAGVSGYFALALLKRITQKGKFGNFAYYCWAVGLVSIIVSIFV